MNKITFDQKLHSHVVRVLCSNPRVNQTKALPGLVCIVTLVTHVNFIGSRYVFNMHAIDLLMDAFVSLARIAVRDL